MVITSEIQLFQILRQKLGDKEAEALVSLKVLATKEDISEVKQEIAIVRTEIATSKSDMIKWFFAFFMALALMIIGLYFKK